MKYVKAFLQLEPGNEQVLRLEARIKKKMDRGRYYIFLVFILKLLHYI